MQPSIAPMHPSPSSLLARKAAYPAVMLLGFLTAYTLHRTGFEALISAYIAATLGAAAVTLLEFAIPYDIDWQPTRDEVKNDLAFMVVVQLLLPQALTLVAVAIVARSAMLYGLTTQFWPAGWPVAAQVTLMLVTAEFLRYWLHVAAHNTEAIWRLHAVHHSPKKLYWLNVGRFHPLEKSLQFMLDALPFIWFGVSETVLAYYFVFYSTNGFFQHSNVDARYGILNYVVSGAELHRWHHSRVPEESNQNYGNNLILWDLVFGTWFLPSERRVGELGLINRAYPEGFLDQMATPLTAGLDKRSSEGGDG